MPWGYLAAFNRYATLDLPATVRKVAWFHQAKNWPRSHTVIPHMTTAMTDTDLQVKHQSADNHRLVRSTILKQAAELHAQV